MVTEEVIREVKALLGETQLTHEELSALLSRPMVTATTKAQAAQIEDITRSLSDLLVRNLECGNFTLLAEHIVLVAGDLLPDFDPYAPSKIGLQRIGVLKNAVFFFRAWARTVMDLCVPDSLLKVVHRGYLRSAPNISKSDIVENVFEGAEGESRAADVCQTTEDAQQSSNGPSIDDRSSTAGERLRGIVRHAGAGVYDTKGHRWKSAEITTATSCGDAVPASVRAVSHMAAEHGGYENDRSCHTAQSATPASLPSPSCAPVRPGSIVPPEVLHTLWDRLLTTLMHLLALDVVPCTRNLVSESLRCLLVLMSYDMRASTENPFLHHMQLNPSEMVAYTTALVRLCLIDGPMPSEKGAHSDSSGKRADALRLTQASKAPISKATPQTSSSDTLSSAPNSFMSGLVQALASPWGVLSSAFSSSSSDTSHCPDMSISSESCQLLLVTAYSHLLSQGNKCLQALGNLKDGPEARVGAVSERNKEDMLTVPFARLYSHLCDATDYNLLLLYTLLYNNREFFAYVVSRTADLDLLLLPLLETLYSQEIFSDYTVYMIIVNILLLSQESQFVEAMFTSPSTQPLEWFTDRSLKDASVGDVVVLVLLRVIQGNLSGERDEFVSETCMAVLSNMAPRILRLHSFTSQRLVALYTMLSKHFIRSTKRQKMDGKIENGDNRERKGSDYEDVTTGDGRGLQHVLAQTREASPPKCQSTSTSPSKDSSSQHPDLASRGVGKVLLGLLRVITTVLSSRLRHNTTLVYCVLVDREAFFSLAQNIPFFAPLVSPIHTLASLMEAKFDVAHQGKDLSSVDVVMETISSATQLLPDDRLPRPHLPTFKYEQVPSPWEFFLPYIWAAVLRENPLFSQNVDYALFNE